MVFAQGVISFRRGLMNLEVAEDFKSYLKDEVVKGSSSTQKKVVGTKVVYVTKLLNDLSFWAEVERFKDIADVVKMIRKGRRCSPEDDIMIHKKAHAIINCYIDSTVVPRVQVNIPNEMVHYILDSASQGQITRGLFHEAGLSIFSVLIIYWRKYLAIRSTREGGASRGSHTHQPHPSSPLSQLDQLLQLQKASNFRAEFTGHFDVGPTLAFSLIDGIKWVFPSLRHHFDIGPPSVLSSTPSSPSHRHNSPVRRGSNRNQTSATTTTASHLTSRRVSRKQSSSTLRRNSGRGGSGGGGGGGGREEKSQLSPMPPQSQASVSSDKKSPPSSSTPPLLSPITQELIKAFLL